MAAFLDACRFNPTAGGTTDWTYSSLVPGYQNPIAAAAVNGRLYKYRAESSDLSQWELGEGAYNSGTGTFARTTVLFNSSGTTSKINFSTVPQVAIVALKEDLISVEEANSFTAAQQAQARSNISASPTTTPITASLGADVAMNNSSLFFTGPSIAQGTSGTWFASGTVTLTDTSGSATTFFCRLWDGTTVIASSNATLTANANFQVSVALSGFIASPAGNLRISCQDANATTGKILGGYSTITAFRIA